MFANRLAHFVVCLSVASWVIDTRAAHAAQVPWHAKGWTHRALVDVTQPGDGGVDVAAVRIEHIGLASPDGNDFRVFDAGGRAVPFQLTHHTPDRDALLSFRCAAGNGTFAVYFGNASAPRAPTMAIFDTSVGAGPPQPGSAADGWIPRAGLIRVTMRRPRDAPNPLTPGELQKLIQQAPAPGIDGAAYVANINDALNPWGDSDYFISAYRGWINLPQPGTWGFCTASNEASFSFIDGRTLRHWPGRHTEQRGKHGEKNVELEFTRSLHYIEYYHEDVLLYQVAFLGCKPPGSPHYTAIPDGLFPQPHRATVMRYETADGQRTVTITAKLVDSVWPTQRPHGQYTRVRFAISAGADDIDLSKWTCRWQFGDGQRATGAQIDHVYLIRGGHLVNATLTSPTGGALSLQRPVAVFSIEHLAGPFVRGAYDDYRPIVAAYELAALSTAALVEAARFFGEVGDDTMAYEAAHQALARANGSPADLCDMHLLIAGDAGDVHGFWARRAAPRLTELAAEHLREAAELQPDHVIAVRINARLIRHVGIELGDVARAQRLYDQVVREVREAGLTDPSKSAIRDATIAIGDVHLFAHRFEEAGEDYRTAEALAQPVIAPQVRATRVGSLPETIAQQFAVNQLDTALQTVRQWREVFPVDQSRGTPLYWLGKIESRRERYHVVIRTMTLVIALARGAEFEAEARWLLALAYQKTGEQDAYVQTLAALVDAGLTGPFREQALTALSKAE
jgi:tetratricopeptide (TPR) repeat protein